MGRANPRKAVAALIPPGGAAIRPMTLGVYAALERIGSPLVTGEEPRDTLELIPSLYLLTHDPREVFRGNVLDLAMQWADAQPVSAVEAIRSAAEAQMAAFAAVLPEAEGASPKKNGRLDRRVGGLGGARLPLELARSHVGGPGQRARAPAAPGGAEGGAAEDLPAGGDRGDGRCRRS